MSWGFVAAAAAVKARCGAAKPRRQCRGARGALGRASVAIAPHEAAAGTLAGGGGPRPPQAHALGRPSCVGLRAFDEPDGVDSFFVRKNYAGRRHVEPAWNNQTSWTKKKHGLTAVYFFPQNHKQKPEETGWVNPKMYKRSRLPRQLHNITRRDKKRYWRKMSNRLQDEWRFRRYARDEAGKVVPGLFKYRTRNPTYRILSK